MKIGTRFLAGIGLGGVAGIIIAVIYASLFGSIGAVIMTIGDAPSKSWLELVQAFGVGLLVFAYSGAIFGGIPAAILGMITGGVLIAIFEHRSPEILTPSQVRRAARRICLIIVLILNGGVIGLLLVSTFQTTSILSGGNGNTEILRMMVTEALPAWAFCLGVPSIIYLLTGWWMAPRIYHTLFVHGMNSE